MGASGCSNARPLRVAIIGTGMIGEVHRRAALLGGAVLVGAMASTPARSADAAARWHTQPIVSLDDLKSLNVDVVHVCSPNQAHAGHVEAAVAAGAHVICEKPLAVTREEAERLQVLAGDAGRIATMPFVYRFHPLIREIRSRVQDGDFGKWQLLHGSYLQDWLLSPMATSWRVDSARGGQSRAFADIGSHWCDLMEFVTGERIASVCAAMTTTAAERPMNAQASFSGGGTGPLVKVKTEDAAALLFRTRSGVLGSAVISQVSAGRKNRLWFEFDGAFKSAVFDQEAPETVWLGSEVSAEILQRDPGRGAPDQRRMSSLPPGHAQGYAQCFENFIADTYAVVRGEARDGLPTFDDGVRSARIVDAVIASAKRGSWVDIEPSGE
jgi:predicted dehydrogenase